MNADSTDIQSDETTLTTVSSQTSMGETSVTETSESEAHVSDSSVNADEAPSEARRTRKPRRRRPAGHSAVATTPPPVAPTEVVDLPQAAGSAAPQVTVTAAPRTRRPVVAPAADPVVDVSAEDHNVDAAADEPDSVDEVAADGPTTGVVGIHREAAQARVQQALDEGLESVVGVIELPDTADDTNDVEDADVEAHHDGEVDGADDQESSASEDPDGGRGRRGRTRRRRRRGGGDQVESADSSAGDDTADADGAADDVVSSAQETSAKKAQPGWEPALHDWTKTSIFSAAIPQGFADEDEPDLTEAALSTDPFIAPPTDKLPPLPPKVVADDDEDSEETDADASYDAGDDDDDDASSRRRRRRRGGRGRRRRGEEETEGEASTSADEETEADEDADADADDASSKRRRRRRRRTSTSSTESPSEGRKSRGDRVTSVKGSTRLEAKRQRRREGRESGRRRPLISESQFLARREAVERSLLVRQGGGRTQVAVLEDNVLVEHYVAQQSQTSMIGNVYLGRVQNVLPSMEAAFVDIGRGRNAVLYAGEVNWDAAGLEGQPRRIELALKSGDSVLVQVTKDPIGHKGARLTSQVTMPGRYLVYVPGGTVTGISQKLPEAERTRLKKILKGIVPEGAGVIVRTAAEGATEAELTADIARLEKQWARIEKKRKTANLATALYTEPDLAIKMIRDVFNADFKELVISGEQAWETVQPYVTDLAPDLADRVRQWDGEGDMFDSLRVNEQIAKAVERKVWLPSGGSLVIDRTEAMTVIDVNTGKFTGQGGNLEATVTENNLEAAEEIIRQLRLRDIGGIVVIDFIDMVLESNRDLVLRRMLECLSRDRTRHQVAEVTSLGLVQMTRKRIGQGLLEAFSECCTACDGRGVILRDLVAALDAKTESKPSKPTKQESKRRAVGAAAVARMAKAAKRTKSEDSSDVLNQEARESALAETVAVDESDDLVDDLSVSQHDAGDEAEDASESAAKSDKVLSPMAALQSSLAVDTAEPASDDAGDSADSTDSAAPASPRPARRRRSRRSSVTKVSSDGSVVADAVGDEGKTDSTDTKDDTE